MAKRGDPDYLAPYRDAIERFGAGFEATLWHSREKQRERFRVIAEMVDLRDARVVDAGCGLGDLAFYLHGAGVSYAHYEGLEAFGELVSRALRDPPAGAGFRLADFVHDEGVFEELARDGLMEVVVFSGSLNTLSVDEMRGVLERAWARAERAVVFNFLSTRHHGRASDDTGPARRMDPVGWVEWALERTPSVRLRTDYFGGHDATVAMLRS